MSTISAGVRFHENVHGIYFDDLDAFQILHNARYLLLIERTIGLFWQRIGWGTWHNLKENVNAQHLVRENHVEYLRPVAGTGEVRVRIWLEKLGRTSLVFGFCVMLWEGLHGARPFAGQTYRTWSLSVRYGL